MPAPTGPKSAMQAESYADLLNPIPDAVALLKESDAAVVKAELLPAAFAGEATVQEAQYHHHHHHHHRFSQRHHHHHHRHHHRGH